MAAILVSAASVYWRLEDACSRSRVWVYTVKTPSQLRMALPRNRKCAFKCKVDSRAVIPSQLPLMVQSGQRRIRIEVASGNANRRIAAPLLEQRQQQTEVRRKAEEKANEEAAREMARKAALEKKGAPLLFTSPDPGRRAQCAGMVSIAPGSPARCADL